MTRPQLYVLVGFPGAGKTTISRLISQVTGAVHIWADFERRQLFGDVTHSPEESRVLYEMLNERVEQLLLDGNSVIFDTNFNFRADREYLRTIATQVSADVVLIWVQTEAELARSRALTTEHAQDNKYPERMPTGDFDRIVGNLEPPTSDEHPIKLRGTDVTAEYIVQALNLSHSEPV